MISDTRNGAAAAASIPALEAGASALDVQRLADKVYRLLQADARLGLKRGALAPARDARVDR